MLLDSLSMRITGIVDPDQRPISGDPDGKKQKNMDGAMRMVFGAIFMDAGPFFWGRKRLPEPLFYRGTAGKVIKL